MRYYVTVGERTFEVELRGEQIVVDGVLMSAELERVAGTLLRRLALDGESHRVVAVPGEERGSWELQLDGTRVHAEVIDERTRAIRAMTTRSGVAQGPRPVRAPMPGMVVRVEVEPGQHVRAGQGVIIIEAMKMKNSIRSTRAGKITEVLVSAGQTVAHKQPLVRFG